MVTAHGVYDLDLSLQAGNRQLQNSLNPVETHGKCDLLSLGIIVFLSKILQPRRRYSIFLHPFCMLL